MDLYSINTYLMENDRQIVSKQLQIADKEDELDRLQNALTELGSNKSDFIGKKSICMDPEFTTTTLHGKNATDLDELRESQLQTSFEAIPEEQISEAEEKISEQIDVVEGEIDTLRDGISSLETRREGLLSQKREVQSKS